MAWYQWLYTALNARWERHAFAQAQIVVAVSERVEAELIAAGVPADCIRTIPNGVDLDEFAPGPVDRSALGLPPSVPLALFVGDLQTPRKNLDTVLQAVSVLPELHLAVAGGTNGSPYPALAEQLGISDRVHFLGFRSDVADLMRAANVCVCPSRYEPFSLVLLEALASGCPVVTTHSVGAAPIVTPACGAVLDDPEDAVALAEALQRIAVGPSLASAETFRRAARSAASAYPWSRTATAYLNALDAIAPPGSSSNASVPTVATPAQT
jgi:glycosyltransferase involved in cell wall biosynthesis